MLLFSTGAAGNEPIDGPNHPAWADFSAAVFEVCLDLAHQIVRDGEGANKFIEIHVEGAVSDESAEVVARSIADSPLVKTAMAAEDANWGRIVMAVGKAGEPADRDKLAIPHCSIGQNGTRRPGKRSAFSRGPGAGLHHEDCGSERRYP